VFLVDDHPLVRVGMAAILGRESDIEVCGEAGTIALALKLIDQAKPDVVSVDITLSGEDGIELVERIHRLHPSISMVIYTMHAEDIWMDQALAAGAKAYVRKLEEPENLVKSIRGLVQSGAGGHKSTIHQAQES